MILISGILLYMKHFERNKSSQNQFWSTYELPFQVLFPLTYLDKHFLQNTYGYNNYRLLIKIHHQPAK